MSMVHCSATVIFIYFISKYFERLGFTLPSFLSVYQEIVVLSQKDKVQWRQFNLARVFPGNSWDCCAWDKLSLLLELCAPWEASLPVPAGL